VYARTSIKLNESPQSNEDQLNMLR